MPCTYSNQMTLMKNSVYFSFPFTAERIHMFNSSTKLMLMVREPVARAFSQYMFGLQRKQIPPGTPMEEVIFQNNILNEEHHWVSPARKITLGVSVTSQWGRFMQMVLNHYVSSLSSDQPTSCSFTQSRDMD